MPTERGDLTHPIHAFLRERRVTSRSSPWNITKMGSDGGGKWQVSDDDYPEFLDNLHDYLFVADNNKGFRPLNLVEQRRADGYSPLLVDLDFQYSTEHALHRRRFDKKNIKTFIKAYIDTLKEFYDIGAQSPLRFFVCLRSVPYESRKGGAKVIKDGVHIECPDLILHSEAQQIVRLGMLDKHAVSSAFDGTSFINAEKDIYDETVIKKNGWFYYGESKPEIPPYQLHAVWSYDPAKDSLAEKNVNEYTPRMLMERLSIRYNIVPSELAIRPEAEVVFAQAKAHLARLNMGPGYAPAVAGGGAGAAGEDVPPSSASDMALAEGMAMIDTKYRDDEVVLARRLTLECLSTSRADAFMTWQEVGWCLHSIDPSDAGFELWMDFSKKSVKYVENDTTDLYRKWQTNWGRGPLDGTTLRLGTLRMWAKTDNPDKYKEIVEDDIVEFIEKEVKATHTSVARILKKMYDGRYVASIEQRETAWFEFTSNTWLDVPQGIDIRNSIDLELSKYVIMAKQRVKRKIRDEEERGTEGITGKILDAKWKELHQLEAKLEASDFKNGIMKEAAGMFYVPKFLLNLDANVYMMGVSNGVLDLRVPTGETIRGKDGKPRDVHKVQHRPGRAQDHVRMQAGNVGGIHPAIPYRAYDPANRDPVHDEIDDFFEKVFPRADLREFMWRLLASHLEGTNKEEIFLIWTGSGGNGKSKLVDLMRYAMGDYAADLNATAVTRKRGDASAASPEIMAIRNKRFIYMQEPEERESLNASVIKQMTSDLMQGRGLFKDLVSFRITGKMHLMCNQLPPIKNIDGGITRRLLVIPYESRFVDPDSVEINPERNVYPKDYELDEKLFRWREAFFSRLVWVYENVYCKTGLNPIPPIVSQVSDKYKESFDGFAKFKSERIRTGEKALEYTATIADLWRAYQTWHREYQLGAQLTRTDFEDKIDKALSQTAESRGVGARKTYRATRVFMSEEEVGEFDAGEGDAALH
jgi:P4 family phage/plasmid primase-like protien